MKDVSIIIPCYNCQDYIGETLQSLANQRNHHFEVICVNDGSTDDTLVVLKQWEDRCVLDMKIINMPNGGVSRARNAGIQAAQGEFLLFLDADDLCHPSFIQLLVDAVRQSGADTAYCWLSRKEDTISRESTPLVLYQTQREVMHNLLHRMPEVGFTCFLYRRELILRINVQFDVNTRRFEDREFIWKYLCHCETAVLVDMPLYYYRVTANSATQSRKVRWSTERLDAVKRVENYMKQQCCEFLGELKDYLFARVMWSVAKTYAVGDEKILLKRLAKEYDVKSCMKRTAKDKNKLVAIASWCYLIHPMLFYHIVRLRK